MINLYDGQITDLLQNPLKYNPETIAVAYAVLQEKRRLIDLVERTRLMAAVDALEEEILDYLAVELRTPAYEDSLPLNTKRALIKGTLPFYAKLGTPAAVDWVINAIFGNGVIEEWFEYGGEPHHFRVAINIADSVIHLSEIEELHRMVYATKRLTSWLDEVHFIIEAKRPATIHVGGGTGAQVRVGIPQSTDDYNFSTSLHTGGAGSIHENMGVPEDREPPSTTTILRTGGVCTILSNL